MVITEAQLAPGISLRELSPVRRTGKPLSMQFDCTLQSASLRHKSYFYRGIVPGGAEPSQRIGGR
jgi:hypothetical protein